MPGRRPPRRRGASSHLRSRCTSSRACAVSRRSASLDWRGVGRRSAASPVGVAVRRDAPRYQADALDRVDVECRRPPAPRRPPPGRVRPCSVCYWRCAGAGRAVVFAPTTAIRAQWVSAARGLAPDSAAVSDDPETRPSLTALTLPGDQRRRLRRPVRRSRRRRWLDDLEGRRAHARRGRALARRARVEQPARAPRGIRSRSVPAALRSRDTTPSAHGVAAPARP